MHTARLRFRNNHTHIIVINIPLVAQAAVFIYVSRRFVKRAAHILVQVLKIFSIVITPTKLAVIIICIHLP